MPADEELTCNLKAGIANMVHQFKTTNPTVSM
jgi:hypothetical protein